MIYLELILGFLRVGCFSFGGAYSAIPLIRDVVMEHGWLTDEALTYMIAVSESTPGPIMVNLATYVGSTQAGILGSALATFAVILPAFIIILLIMVALRALIKHPCTQAVLNGLKPCVAGIIMATGLVITGKSFLSFGSGFSVDGRSALIAAIMLFIWLGGKPIFKKKVSPIMMIVISAVLGLIVFAF